MASQGRFQRQNEDEQPNLLAIFPTEIWHIIFDKISNPEDMANLVAASATFKEFLEARKPVYLFPVILKHIDKHRFLSCSDTPDILNYRLVCTGWKLSVDKLLQTRPYHCKLPKFSRDNLGCTEYDNRLDPAFPAHFNLYDFNLDNLLNEIIPGFSSPLYKTHCPFPSRHLTISETKIIGAYLRPFDPRVTLLHRCRTASVKFLEKVGHHFWHATIEVHGGQLDWYKLLVKYAQLMPNLRSLYIICSRMDMALQTNDAEFAQFMAKEYLPFPSLKKLELLSVSRIPGLALNEILSSGKIKNVAIHREQNDEFQIARVQFPENLSVTICSTYEFRSLPVFWKPKILNLDLKMIPIKGFNWPAFFPILENYSETLEELSLVFPTEHSSDYNKRVWDCTSKCRLNLAKLTSLTVYVDKHISLDFLLGLTSLKCIFLHLPEIDYSPMPEEYRSNDNIISIVECLVNWQIMECNIWDLVPTLSKIFLGNEESSLRWYRRNSTNRS